MAEKAGAGRYRRRRDNLCKDTVFRLVTGAEGRQKTVPEKWERAGLFRLAAFFYALWTSCAEESASEQARTKFFAQCGTAGAKRCVQEAKVRRTSSPS